jgi:hypothetical protein
MLTNCPECENDVSEQAAACPRCGHPMIEAAPVVAPAPAPAGRSKFGVALLVGLLVAIIAVIALLAFLLVPGWKKDAARSQLESSPWQFVTGLRWNNHDKGIVNTYSHATSVEFRNASEFDVTDISGKLTYLGAGGAEMAVVPFKASGELQAGATTMLSVSAGEISGGAATVSVRVEHVRVRK